MTDGGMKTFAEESAAYLELHDVYYVLHDLQKNLIKDQPADPIKYMIARLEAEKPLKLCLVGAPGTDRSTTATALAKQFGVSSFMNLFGLCLLAHLLQL